MIKRKLKIKNQRLTKQSTILLCKICMSEIDVELGYYECPICSPMS